MIWRCTSILKNKRLPWNFEDFGKVAILNIASEIESYYDEWLINTSRQESYQTHKETFVFELTSLDYMHAIGTPGQCVTERRMSTANAREELSDIIRKAEELASGKLIRAEFINMKPNSRIRTHKDRSDILYVARRFHIPIKTNELVLFSSGDETKHLELGKLYELNNINYHSVVNSSDTNRIHLIIDVLPEQYLEGIEFTDVT